MPRRGYKLIEPAGGQEFAGRFFVDKKIYVYIIVYIIFELLFKGKVGDYYFEIYLWSR